MINLTFGTGNPNKLQEVKEILGGEVIGYTQEDLDKIAQLPDGDVPEIQSMDIVLIAKQKAKAVYQALGRSVIVEDTGLFIESKDGYPGPFIKYTLDQIGNEGILKLMEGVSNRVVKAVTCVSLYDGTEYTVGYGEVTGDITQEERTGETKAFGYDPIFQPEGYDKTFAEMNSDEKNSISMRKLAFVDFIKNYNK